MSDPLAGHTVRQVLFDTLFKRVNWPRGKTLARSLVEALDDLAGAAGSEPEREAQRRGEFLRMLRRVAADIDTHRRRDVFLRFLADGRRLADPEVFDLAEYLYSGMVNALKGELAELLVRPSIRQWIDAAGLARDGPVEIISGWRIESPSLRVTRRTIWKKGADALVVRRDGAALTLVGVVEIKSYDISEPAVTEQLERHVSRLRRGLRIDGVAVDDYTLAGEKLLGVRTCPRGRRAGALHSGSGAVWLAHLPFAREELAQAAYLLVEWFWARGGADAFGAANPWPEASIETAGHYAFMEELHHLLTRTIVLSRRDGTKRSARAASRLAWIYNSLTVGYENAVGDEMQWIDDFLPPKTGVDALIDDARDAYRKGEFERTDARIAEAAAMPQTEKQRRQLAWLAAMSLYRRASFARALELLPPPSDERGDPFRSRDAIMHARLLARCGRETEAEAMLQSVEPLAQWRAHGITMEATAVRALLAATRGDRQAVAAIAGEIIALIDRINAERDEARRQQIADPHFDLQAFEMACLDLGCTTSHLGEGDAAVAWLRRVLRPDSWTVAYLDLDPWLDAARRSSLARSLRAEWRRNAVTYGAVRPVSATPAAS
jgi:hypothetical protein